MWFHKLDQPPARGMHSSGAQPLNARTDVFLGKGVDASKAIVDALDRAEAYAAAGASGFFVPGLQDDRLIARLCESVGMPVNIMVMDGVSSNARLTELGVSRISYGPIPYIKAMNELGNEARNVLGV